MSAQDAVFVLVLVVRLLVPLAIPRFPLPGILAALVLDAVDQTVFQAVGASADLRGYQSYDKAFDVYYLTIAYASMLRNWDAPFALSLGRFLFYYRLVGVVAFELTGSRPLLLIFPNTFEYFFIVYEAIRLRWNPSRLDRAQLVGLAAAIWILVKLPQEWWIHIAQLDVTDVIADNGWLVPVLAGVGTLLLLSAAPFLRRLPPAQWRPSLDADARVVQPREEVVAREMMRQSFWSAALLEKVLLISMVAVVFSQVLPGVVATSLQLTAGVAFVVVTNAAISQWRLRSGALWASTLVQFLAMTAFNTVSVLLTAWLLRRGADASFRISNTLFFLLLISLIVTLYDRYRIMGRLSRARRAPETVPAAAPA